MCASKIVKRDNVHAILDRALGAGSGLLRLTPNWVPRNFLHPGKRIKLAPTDWYALGTHRGGIDERWFASTTEAANDGRAPDEGLSYCVFEGERFLLRDAVEEAGPRIVGPAIWEKYKRWPVYSKFFDNMGPIPHHMHQQAKHAALTGQQGKPECYYFPPQLNAAENHFDYTFMGLEPGTTKAEVRRCLENWDKGDNGILDLSKAYRLKAGTGWMVPAGVLHAPGSMCTYEPQWGSDVFGMYQSLVEGREVPWDLLVKDVPKDKHRDLDFIVEQLDWEKNVDPYFVQHNYVEPIVDQEKSGPGYTDRWIDYGRFDGEQLVSAKELTVMPGAKCVLKDPGASGWITVQGCGRMGKLTIQAPVMIHYGEEPWDEVFITHEAATAGVEITNTGGEPLVGLRYFGPAVHQNMPEIGDHRKK
ncbi:MAG: hypothetical protein ABFC63_11090 [Thermoguttaceae bacterium]